MGAPPKKVSNCEGEHAGRPLHAAERQHALIGAHHPHAYDAYVDLAPYEAGCQLTLALASAE